MERHRQPGPLALLETRREVAQAAVVVELLSQHPLLVRLVAQAELTAAAAAAAESDRTLELAAQAVSEVVAAFTSTRRRRVK